MGSINKRYQRLVLDFRYLGIRCREQTKLVDSPTNRKRAKQILEQLEAEITLGTCDYAKYFPKSKMVRRFESLQLGLRNPNQNIPLFKFFAEIWFSENEIAWRASHRDTIRSTLDKHLPHLLAKNELMRSLKLTSWLSVLLPEKLNEAMVKMASRQSV